jgi:uncharacterized damage-inducible protein DinB
VTYYGGKDMAAAFRTVRTNTLTIAEEIPESQYGFKPSADSRSIGATLTHIALIPTIPSYIHGKKVTDLKDVPFFEIVKDMMAEEAKPRTKAEIIALLKTEADKFEAYLSGLSEEFLAEPVTMPAGDTRPFKSRFEMLLGVKEHEMHHRAQLMVMQRMIGQVNHLTRHMQARFAQATAAPAAR